jgi:hypothetical protein
MPIPEANMDSPANRAVNICKLVVVMAATGSLERMRTLRQDDRSGLRCHGKF